MIALSSSASFNSAISGRFALSFGGSSGPTVPQNLTATAGDRQVALVHDAFPGATDYKYYRNTINDFATATLISDPPETVPSYDDIQGNPGELYYYWAVAVTAGGDTGPSAPATARAWVVLANLSSISLTAPAGTWTFGTILFGSTTPPVGINILYGGTLYSSLGDGTWENTDTFEMATNDPISGSFEVSNSGASAFTFWNTEPA
jgi:hypothetical protein